MGLTTLSPLCAECLEILAASTSWPLRVCPATVGIDFEDETQSILHSFNLHRENQLLSSPCFTAHLCDVFIPLSINIHNFSDTTEL